MNETIDRPRHVPATEKLKEYVRANRTLAIDVLYVLCVEVEKWSTSPYGNIIGPITARHKRWLDGVRSGAVSDDEQSTDLLANLLAWFDPSRIEALWFRDASPDIRDVLAAISPEMMAVDL